MYPNNNCNDCSQCPTEVTPLPLPDLSGICGDEYNAACVIYTGPNITCLGITSGMTFLEIINIFNNRLPLCDCCEKIPQDCVLSDWGPWGNCECYYEDELLICGKQTRTRTIITPPLNGGAPCGELTQTRDCEIQDVCFTFGSAECEIAGEATQVLAQPAGIYNNKPYYALLTCSGDTIPMYVWYNISTDKWTTSAVLGTATVSSQLLDNNGNYLPLSNNTTEVWSAGNLISSQFAPCPTAKICFKVNILVEDNLFTYYFNVAPTLINANGYPEYDFSITTPDTNVYNFRVRHNGLIWEFRSSKNSGAFVTKSTMDIEETPYYPIGSSTDWTSIPGTDPVLVMSSYDACVQPPDVDCVWTCVDPATGNPWSACNAGCTQTRVCTITTPASGNGICTPKPAEQQSCCTPSCNQPISPTVTIVEENIVVSFTAVSGAVGYTLTYTTDGVSYSNLTSTLPSFSFPWTCGLTYSGWVVTNCATLNSAQTPFSITIPPCPAPLFCNGSPLAFISGNMTSSQQALLKINSSAGDINGTKPVLSGVNVLPNNAVFMTNELAQDGIFLGGKADEPMSDAFGSYTTGGVLKLKCNSTSSTFFGEIDRTFIGITSGQGFGVKTGSTDIPTIHAIKYYAPTNRIYVGGRFDKYKGVTCSSNLVCLDASTGAIVPSTTFKLGIAGLDYSGSGKPEVLDIQIDNTNPSQPKLVVAGAFNRYTSNTNIATPAHNIIRLNMDGTIDSSFVINGTSFSQFQSQRDTTTQYIGAYSFVKTVHIDALGDIYAGGGFYQYKGIPAYNIVKIKYDGSIANVSEFDAGTGFLKPNGGLGINSGWYRPYKGRTMQYGPPDQYGVSVEKIVPHINGLLITGNFAYYNSSDDNNDRANGLIKINTDGTRDTLFTIDTTSAYSISPPTTTGRCGYDITVLNDDKVLLAGYFTNYLGTPGGSKGYYVLNADGTVNSSYTITTTAGFLFVKTIASYFL